MTTANAIQSLQRIIIQEFDSLCDEKTTRATLLELGNAITGIQTAILFSDIADRTGDDTLSNTAFLSALGHLKLAAMCFKQSAIYAGENK